MIYRIIVITTILILCSHFNVSATDYQKPTLEIPNTVWEPIFFKSINIRTEEAALIDLRKVYLRADSVEIRIWIGFGLSFLEGLIIKKENGQSSAWYIPPKHKTTIIQLSEPKSGWNELWKRLSKNGLYTLPDSAILKNRKSIRDGVSYVVEVNSEGRYRTYEYGNPNHQPWPEGKQLLNIVKGLRYEFGI